MLVVEMHPLLSVMVKLFIPASTVIAPVPV